MVSRPTHVFAAFSLLIACSAVPAHRIAGRVLDTTTPDSKCGKSPVTYEVYPRCYTGHYCNMFGGTYGLCVPCSLADADCKNTAGNPLTDEAKSSCEKLCAGGNYDDDYDDDKLGDKGHTHTVTGKTEAKADAEPKGAYGSLDKKGEDDYKKGYDEAQKEETYKKDGYQEGKEEGKSKADMYKEEAKDYKEKAEEYKKHKDEAKEYKDEYKEPEEEEKQKEDEKHENKEDKYDEADEHIEHYHNHNVHVHPQIEQPDVTHTYVTHVIHPVPVVHPVIYPEYHEHDTDDDHDWVWIIVVLIIFCCCFGACSYRYRDNPDFWCNTVFPKWRFSSPAAFGQSYPTLDELLRRQTAQGSPFMLMRMVLQGQLNGIRNRELFNHELRRDLATELDVPTERIQIDNLHAGSIIVDFTLLAGSEGDLQDMKNELQGKAQDLLRMVKEKRLDLAGDQQSVSPFSLYPCRGNTGDFDFRLYVPQAKIHTQVANVPARITEWPCVLNSRERVHVCVSWALTPLGATSAGGVDAPVALLGPSSQSPFLLADEVWRGCACSSDGAVQRLPPAQQITHRQLNNNIRFTMDLGQLDAKVHYVAVALVAPYHGRAHPLNQLLEWVEVTIAQGGVTRTIALNPIPHQDTDTASLLCTFFRPSLVPHAGVSTDPSVWAVDRTVIGMDTSGEAQPLRMMEQFQPALHHWMQSKSGAIGMGMTPRSNDVFAGCAPAYSPHPHETALAVMDGVEVSCL